MVFTRRQAGQLGINIPAVSTREALPGKSRRARAKSKAVSASTPAAVPLQLQHAPAPTPDRERTPTPISAPTPTTTTRKRKRKGVDRVVSGVTTKERRMNAENTRQEVKKHAICGEKLSNGKTCGNHVVYGQNCYKHNPLPVKKPSIHKGARMGRGVFSTLPIDKGEISTMGMKKGAVQHLHLQPGDTIKNRGAVLSKYYKPTDALLHNVTRRDSIRKSNMKIIYKGHNRASVNFIKNEPRGRELFLYNNY